MTTDTRKVTRRRWVTPAFAAAIGVVYLVAGLVGGDEVFGWTGLALMFTVAVTIWMVSLKSELIDRLLLRNDERINSIDRDAALLAGMTLLLVVLGAFVVEVARGQDGQPYAALGALTGVAYIAAFVTLRMRR